MRGGFGRSSSLNASASVSGSGSGSGSGRNPSAMSLPFPFGRSPSVGASHGGAGPLSSLTLALAGSPNNLLADGGTGLPVSNRDVRLKQTTMLSTGAVIPALTPSQVVEMRLHIDQVRCISIM